MIAGLLLSLLAAIGVVVVVNGRRARAAVVRDARDLHRDRTPASRPEIDTADLPAPVRRYLDLALRGRTRPIDAVRLTHGGTFRTGAGRAWLPIAGEQYFAADPPAFLWWGRIRMAPGVWVDARDSSIGGEGRMRVRAAWTIPLGNASGPELDQGALLRLLGEMAWFPTAYADSRYVTWSPIDDRAAEATLRVGGRQVRARIEFGEDGLLRRAVAERHRDVGARAVLLPWHGEMRDYREVEGVLVPFEAEAVWDLKEGPLPYARFIVERIEFDRREPFAAA